MPKNHTLPQKMQGREALELARTLEDHYNKSDEIICDFKNVRSMTPFAMIFTISQLRKYKKLGKITRIANANFSPLNHNGMNFFNTLLRKTVSEQNQQSGRIPITTVRKNDILGNSVISRNDAGELINNYATKLTNAFLSNTQHSDFFCDTIQYSLREIIRNIIEHSHFEYFIFCADYNETSHTAEICISDNGIGIYQTLKSNPFLSGLKPENFLKYSCLPGISGNTNLYNGKSSDNIWENSGFGLYMIRRICQDYGGFFLISNNQALYRGRDSDCGSNRLDRKFKIPNTSGTTIRLNINVNTMKNETTLRSNLKRYVEEAQKYKKFFKELVINPSMASQMLRRDFKN